jgi:glycosyltransferase involved in cell wall biosynthesis
MKVLHVIPSFVPAWRYGGPIYAAQTLTREMARQGHEVVVMTTNIDGPSVLDVPLGRPVLMDGVEVWYFPVEPPRWWCFSRALGRALRAKVKYFDLVDIHSIFLWPTTVAAHSCQRWGVPYVIKPSGALDPTCLNKSYETTWVSLTSRAKKWLYFRTLAKVDLGRASAIHFMSQAELEATRPLRLRPPGFVVPLGVECGEFEEEPTSVRLRGRYPQLDGKKVVLFLSRLDPIKGLDLLIPALGELARRREDFVFVLAGMGHHAYEAELAGLVEKHGLQDRTVVLGFVQGEDKRSLLRRADLFVLPSYHESFSIAIVEAMAAGLPVIVSDRVSICREVSELGAGLVTGMTREEIAAAVDLLLEDENLRRDMGRKGAHLVSEQFNLAKVVSDLVRVYERIVQGRALVPRNAESSSGKLAMS